MVPEINTPTTTLSTPYTTISHFRTTTNLTLVSQMFDMMSGGRTRFPFTASQWQELEHQALIFKYMVSGIPVPPDLLYTIKRSFVVDSSLSSKLLSSPPPQHVGWNCFQIGLGRKVDPEPGRCRRTDGKKWRCSKEAYPDSKYCERHMHRGKSRSRKPVEFSATATSSATNCSPVISSSPSSSSSSKDHLFSLSNDPTHFQHRPPAANYNTYHHHHDPTLHAAHRNGYRRESDFYGLKEDVDEHPFFSEPRGTVRSFSGSSVDDDPWQLSPLAINSSATKQRAASSSTLQNEYSYLQLQSLAESRSPREEKQDHIISLRRDVKCEMAMELDKGEMQRTVHHFFDEWPPPKDKDSWLHLDDRSSNTASLSTTRLSISMPSHDFPIFNSRSRNDA